MRAVDSMCGGATASQKANELVDEGRFCDRCSFERSCTGGPKDSRGLCRCGAAGRELLAAMVMPRTVPGRYWRRQANRANGDDAEEAGGGECAGVGGDVSGSGAGAR
jgi:hypothetical protein